MKASAMCFCLQKLTMHTPLSLMAGVRYLPFPGELFDNIKTEGLVDQVFWLDLNGVLEFIETSSQRYLNHSDPMALSLALEALKNTVGDELALHRQSLREMAELKILFLATSIYNGKSACTKNSENILFFTVDEGFTMY